MKKRLLSYAVLFTISCLVSLLCATANAGQNAVPYFSNQDIEQYKNPSDNKPNKTELKREKAKKTKEQEEKEYWCKKATEHRKKIEKAQADVKASEKKIAETEETDMQNIKKKKGSKQAKKDLSRAKKQLKEAENNLGELEDKAHRKGIPPGWLRCQFDW